MWIDLEGLANLRDLGGTPTEDGGSITAGRLLRSDNLQGLTEADVRALLDLGLTDVVDLRSAFEVTSEGPGPLMRESGVTVHHHSLFRDNLIDETDVDGELSDKALPWVDLPLSVQVDNYVTSTYLSYLVDRPDSILASLRAIATADGATLVHCAAGKDRTGTVVALALKLAGAETHAVVADYAASTERMQAILDRLMASETYADNLRGRPLSSHETHAETMNAFLEHVDAEYDGVNGLLAQLGWTDEDSARIRAKLRS